MYLYAVLAVYKSKNVVARYGMTTLAEDKLVYAVVGDVYGLFTIEAFGNDKVVLFVLFLLAFVLGEERYILAPFPA